MPQVSPFRGLRYSADRFNDLSAVICPPYDVITPEQRAALAARDEHNAVHVELPQPDQLAGHDQAYEQAAEVFRGWQAEGSLRRDEASAIYIYEQEYDTPSGRRRARGFYCLLALERFGDGVRAHERTMAGPKEDRRRLISAVKANLSPVIMLYEEGATGPTSAELLQRLCRSAPTAQAVDDAGVEHRIWLAEPGSEPAAAALLELAGSGALTVADGHHRYETALLHRDEERAAGARDDSAGWVMVLLYEAGSGGLSVLPTHRVVLGAPDCQEIVARAARLFSVSEADDLGQLEAAVEVGRLGVWTSSGGALLEIDRPRVSGLLPAGTSEALRWLDVNVLTSALGELVGTKPWDLLDEGRLMYIKEMQQALGVLQGDPSAAIFLLPATPIEAVLEVAAAGEQMPHKSTYFQPKAATGLVFNPLSQ